MKIASIKLHNFKRFTDLVIKNIPNTAKLVLIVGPNGCGKSSLFDALLQWYRGKVGFGYNADEPYFRKDTTMQFGWEESVSVILHDGATPKRGSLYVRTAYRNDPDFSVTGFNRPELPTEGVRITRVIDNDQTVGSNYQRLVYDTMSGVYNSENDTKSVLELRNELIGQLRNSMKAVFGDLALNNISDPLLTGSFFFEKGTAKNYHYKNLSGGEKATFDLLLDLHIKKRFFNDAIYCIDEIETHLHTKVQGTLLKEMVSILPDGSQLWVTTHSLGVIRAALEMATQAPGTVSIIDFDGVDPDIPREIAPSNLSRVTWEKALSIALDDLSTRLSPKHIIICEGSSVGSRRKDFDAEIYNRIFSQNLTDVVFVSGGNSEQVQRNSTATSDILRSILPQTQVHRLIDRDDRSAYEVEQLRSQGTLVLEQRNLESYLFADEVIEALVSSKGNSELIADALRIKGNELAASIGRGNAPDDLKSASGSIYINLKALLQLTRCGNNKDEFMRDTLAPLITPHMQCYQELRSAIIDRIIHN